MCPVAPITTTRPTRAGYSALAGLSVIDGPPGTAAQGEWARGTGPRPVTFLALQDRVDLALCRVQCVRHGFRTGQGSLYGCPYRLGDLRVLHAQAERAWVGEQRLVDIDPPRGACLLHVDLRHGDLRREVSEQLGELQLHRGRLHALDVLERHLLCLR